MTPKMASSYILIIFFINYKFYIYSFAVKSPESHLARSRAARNLSHVARNFSNVAPPPKKVKSPEEINTKKIWISDC